jgi:tetratricopeptide (TPR) repeat protein
MSNVLIKDKTTIVSNAQKFAKKGKIDKAIAQWTKLLTVSNDAQIYNTIGDLYLKKGAHDNALEFFMKAAAIFKKNGFYSKATGIYNKILTIDPYNLDALVASSRLNAERGLPGKAVEDFLEVSEKLITDGAEEKALVTLEKALSIFPIDTDIESKIRDVSSLIEIKNNSRKNRWGKLRLFKWGSGRASVRPPEKVKRQRKKSRSFFPRAAVFVLVFSATLAVTFEDIERKAGIPVPETDLVSVKDADERPLSSDLEEGYAGGGTVEYSGPVQVNNLSEIKKTDPEAVETVKNSEPEPGRKTADPPIQFTYKKVPQPITLNIDPVISGKDHGRSADVVVSEMWRAPEIQNKLTPEIALIVKSRPVLPAFNKELLNDTGHDGKVQN